MACTTNKLYQKSAIETFNSSTQTLTTTAVTPLNLVGTVATDTGCSLSASGQNVTICNSGLYYIGADVTFTPTAAGTEIIQLYKDGIALPCAIAQATGTVGAVATVHVETVLQVNACCAVQPVITVRASGATVGINFVSVTAVKLA